MSQQPRFLGKSEDFDKVTDIYDMVNNILTEVIVTFAEKERRKYENTNFNVLKKQKKWC